MFAHGLKYSKVVEILIFTAAVPPSGGVSAVTANSANYNKIDQIKLLYCKGSAIVTSPTSSTASTVSMADSAAAAAEVAMAVTATMTTSTSTVTMTLMLARLTTLTMLAVLRARLQLVLVLEATTEDP